MEVKVLEKHEGLFVLFLYGMNKQPVNIKHKNGMAIITLPPIHFSQDEVLIENFITKLKELNA